MPFGFASTEPGCSCRIYWEETMPSLRDLMDQETRSVRLQPDRYERTLGRAKRKARRTRLATVGAALIVFLVPAAWLGWFLWEARMDDVVRQSPSGEKAHVGTLLTYPGRSTDDALASGRLDERDGCTFLTHSDGSTMLLAWPEGMSLGRGADGRATIVDRKGNTIAEEGEDISVSGGALSAADGSAPETVLGREIPKECRTSEVWLVGEVVTRRGK